MPVAIFGDRSCGKTVFLSLLYHSQIRYSNSKDNKGVGQFKFTTEPQFASTMGSLNSDLISGLWADSNLKGTLAKYSFKYGFRKLVPGGTAPSDKFDIIDFTVFDIAGEDLDIIRSLETFAKTMPSTDRIQEFDFNLVSESFRKLLDCNVFVFLLDLSKINAQPRTPKQRELMDYDNFMATLISAISKYKSKKYDKNDEKGKIYPVFMLTKFDVLDKKILSDLHLPESYGDLDKKKRPIFGGGRTTRDQYVKEIMRRFYPHTMALASGGILANVDFDKAAYFFSQIVTDLNDDGDEIPKVKRIDGVPTLLYSEDEYRGFIDYFKKIVKKMSDGEMADQEFSR